MLHVGVDFAGYKFADGATEQTISVSFGVSVRLTMAPSRKVSASRQLSVLAHTDPFLVVAEVGDARLGTVMTHYRDKALAVLGIAAPVVCRPPEILMMTLSPGMLWARSAMRSIGLRITRLECADPSSLGQKKLPANLERTTCAEHMRGERA